MITDKAVELACAKFAEFGIDFRCPWQCDLDDVERERYEALRAALLAAYPEMLEELTRERDKALWRVEELEAEAERVSFEFEGDCWKAMRALLNECCFDWGYADPEGISAEDAREHISTTIAEFGKTEKHLRSRVSALTEEVARLRRALQTAASIFTDMTKHGLIVIDAADHGYRTYLVEPGVFAEIEADLSQGGDDA